VNRCSSYENATRYLVQQTGIRQTLWNFINRKSGVYIYLIIMGYLYLILISDMQCIICTRMGERDREREREIIIN